jgi:uncharacterized repeat protein (TIGR03803 family)
MPRKNSRPSCFVAASLRSLLLIATVFSARAQTNVALTTLYTFSSTVSSTNADGTFPSAALLVGSDGALYGTAFQGGAAGYGTVFRITPSGNFTALAQFDGPNGRGPSTPLIRGQDGGLYGTTQNGGSNNVGTVFRITTNGVLTRLHSFAGGLDGSYPLGGLVQAADGFLYGTTESGGTNNYGTVFKLTTNGVMSRLFSFGNTNGAYPRAALLPLADGNGNFFGTTHAGGTRGAGTIFKFSPQGALIFSFPFSYTNGFQPDGALLLARDGNFWGTTRAGGPGNGTNGYGSVYQMTLAGAITPVAFFNNVNGSAPECSLIQAKDGNFYGTTLFGSVFKMTPNGIITPLVSFVASNNIYPWGLFPQEGLVEGLDGNLYGVTQQGGTGASHGTIYRINLRPHFLSSGGRTNGNYEFSWSAIPGQHYGLQYSTNSTNWANLGSPITATNGTMTTTDIAPPDPMRLYRLTLMP